METAYDRFAKLLKMRNITPYKVYKDTGIATATLSDWKNGKSVPKQDKMKTIADYLDISIDFLMGKTDMVVCPECGFGNNPLSEQSRMEHEKFHKRFLEVKEEYPFFMKYTVADYVKTESIFDFRNPSKDLDERLSAFERYLQASFSLEIIRCDYDTEYLIYSDFCKYEVGSLRPDGLITQEIIDSLIEIYGISRDYSPDTEILLARTSNNKQLMRILAYAEKLTPDILDSIEVQIKALAEKNDNEG